MACISGIHYAILEVLNNRPWFKYKQKEGIIEILDSPTKRINYKTSIGVADSTAKSINFVINKGYKKVGDIAYATFDVTGRGIIRVSPTINQVNLINAQDNAEIEELQKQVYLENQQKEFDRLSEESNTYINEEGDVVSKNDLKNSLFGLDTSNQNQEIQYSKIGKELSLQRTEQIKQIFDSNPELANRVYEALEYNQDTYILENNGELAYNEYNKAIHESTEKLSLKDAIQRAVNDTNSPYLKILGNILLSNNNFLVNRKAYIATDENKFTTALGKNGQGFNGFILSINNPKTIIHEAIHTYTGAIIDVNINEKDVLNEFELNFKNKIKELYDIAKEHITDEYGITDEHEFLAEISNTAFINKLKNIPYKKGNIWNEFVETIKNLFKNLFLKTFTINSDIQQKDNEYFLELKFNNGNTQNQYFKTKKEAEEFIKTINNDISLDNVAGQLINEFLKVVNYRANQITPQQKQQAQQLYSDFLDKFVKRNFDKLVSEMESKNLIEKKCN